MIGQTINNYIIERKLGEGGMGNVYYARHNRVDRFVAIKVLHHNLFANESIRSRFKNEANALIKLTHANIVKIYDYVEQDNLACLIMEFIEGYTLDDYIVKVSGPLPAAKAIHIICEILDAVQYAHDHNVYHRDIKPGNIMLSRDGRHICIMDFGIAKFTDASNLNLTSANTQLGTPFYMSPEQVTGMPYTAKSDVYSLGVTLFEMVTGKCPYLEITNLFELQSKIVNEPLPPTNKYYPGVLPKIQEAIKKATNKIPEHRFKDCNEFKKYLAEEEKLKPVITLPPIQQQPPKPYPIKPRPRAAVVTQLHQPATIKENKKQQNWVYLLLLLLIFAGCGIFYFGNNAIIGQKKLDKEPVKTQSGLPANNPRSQENIDSIIQSKVDSLIRNKELSTGSYLADTEKRRELAGKLSLMISAADAESVSDSTKINALLNLYWPDLNPPAQSNLISIKLPTLTAVLNDLDGKTLCNGQSFSKNTRLLSAPIYKNNNGQQCYAVLTFNIENDEKCRLIAIYNKGSNAFIYHNNKSEIITKRLLSPLPPPRYKNFCAKISADLLGKKLCGGTHTTGDKIISCLPSPENANNKLEYEGNISFIMSVSGTKCRVSVHYSRMSTNVPLELIDFVPHYE